MGVFSGNARGFGFVAIEGQEEDVFIPADRTGGALHGNRVQIVIDSEGRGGRPEGTVVRILEHANETLVGIYEKGKGYGFVIPDNQRISKDIFYSPGMFAGRSQRPQGHGENEGLGGEERKALSRRFWDISTIRE